MYAWYPANTRGAPLEAGYPVILTVDFNPVLSVALCSSFYNVEISVRKGCSTLAALKAQRDLYEICSR